MSEKSKRSPFVEWLDKELDKLSAEELEKVLNFLDKAKEERENGRAENSQKSA